MKTWQKTPFTVIILLFIGFTSCETNDESTKNRINSAAFENVLDYCGIPPSAADKSVFTFSDNGAWHSYALPSDSNTYYNGSFIGPYLMTQENGIWLSVCLSRLEIIDTKSNVKLDLANARIIKKASYLHKLYQLLELEEGKIRIEVELQFLSNRSALISTTIKNQTEDKNKGFIV